METVTSGRVNQIFLKCVEDCLEPIMLTDVAGKLTYVNPAWVMTYGYSKEEALGKTPRLLRSNLQSDEFYKSIWATIMNPEVGFWKGELINRAKDGHLVPVLLTITPYRESSDQIVGYMGIAMDLSAQKTMEQQILHQDRMASVGLLAGGLAHEIGNPLGAIRGRAELVLNRVQNDEVSKKNVEIILGQIDRISSLIQSLLRVSRVPEKISLERVHLGNAIKDVVFLTAEECRRSNIRVETGDLDFQVVAEANHLQQLLLNVVINSIHAIEEQKVKYPDVVKEHSIQFSASATGENRLVLSVEDTGCGISRENLSKLFKPFFTTKEVGKGTGLGLAVVAKLVDEVGARVTVHSEGVGRGARFDFTFRTD